MLYLDKSANELRFKVTTADGVAARPGIPASLLDTTSWHHVMGVYNGAKSEAAIYFDGQLASVLSAAGSDGKCPFGASGGYRFSGGRDDSLCIEQFV